MARHCLTLPVSPIGSKRRREAAFLFKRSTGTTSHICPKDERRNNEPVSRY